MNDRFESRNSSGRPLTHSPGIDKGKQGSGYVGEAELKEWGFLNWRNKYMLIYAAREREEWE